MLLLAIMALSSVVQFWAAGISLFLVPKSPRWREWGFIAFALVLMGVRRAYLLAQAVSLGAAPDPLNESMTLLISVLLLVGVWLIRGEMLRLSRLRLSAEAEVERRKQAEAELSVSLRAAEEATALWRESEEKLRFLGDNLPGVLLYQLDCGVDGCDRRFSYVSRGVEQVHEMTVAEAMASPYAIYAQLYEEDIRGFGESERLAIESRSLFRAETRIKLPSGQTKWILIASAPRRAANGHLVWDGFEVDITDRKRLEEALRLHSETLEAAVADRTASLRYLSSELVKAEQQERRRLSDYLHDDLQQVLVGAKFVAEKLVSERQADAAAGELCKLRDVMVEALNKTRTLSNELATPLLYEVGLVPALRQVAGEMKKRYGLEVAFEVKDFPDVQKETLKVQLFHSVRELLFNVVKHSGTREARLKGGVAQGKIEISVEDSGKGFAAGGSRGAAAGGIGLFNIGERIGALGGSLTVDSSPGSGACVTISVPVSPDPEPAQQAARLPPSGASGGADPDGRARVLVADDHALVRQGVVTLLSQEPALVVVGEAASGREAVEQARRLRPDVVVMDLRMPEMGGIESTRLILSEFPSVIVIGLSAFGDEGFRTEMLNAGAVGLLDKANVSVELPSEIAEWLGRRGVRDGLQQPAARPS